MALFNGSTAFDPLINNWTLQMLTIGKNITLEARMFITTPFIRWTANRLYMQGKIEVEQRDRLIAQDKQLNIVITAGAIFILINYFIL